MRRDEGGRVRRGELWKRQDSSGLHKGTVLLLLVGQLFLISVCLLGRGESDHEIVRVKEVGGGLSLCC